MGPAKLQKNPRNTPVEREIYTYLLHKSQVQQKVLKEIFWRDKIPGWDFFFFPPSAELEASLVLAVFSEALVSRIQYMMFLRWYQLTCAKCPPLN